MFLLIRRSTCALLTRKLTQCTFIVRIEFVTLQDVQCVKDIDARYVFVMYIQ